MRPVRRAFRWQGRIPDILDALGTAPEILDRPAIEKIFGIPKRSAWFLMDRFGAQKVGSSLAVKRDALIEWLRAQARIAPARDPASVPIEKGRVKSVETSGGLRRTEGGVEIPCADRKDLLARLAALAKSLQDPRVREKLFAELGL